MKTSRFERARIFFIHAFCTPLLIHSAHVYAELRAQIMEINPEGEEEKSYIEILYAYATYPLLCSDTANLRFYNIRNEKTGTKKKKTF